MGIASFILIALYVYGEWSYDRYHSKADRIFRVYEVVNEVRTTSSTSIKHAGLPRVPVPLAPVLSERFDEIEQTVRLYSVYETQSITNGEQLFNEDNTYYVEPSLFDIFDIQVLVGNPKVGLSRPQTVFLSKSIAEKYFGSENPIGQVITVDNDKSFEVAGIFKDLPGNSHLKLDILYSFESLGESLNSNFNRWTRGLSTYISVKPGVNMKLLEEKLHALPTYLKGIVGNPKLISKIESFGLLPLTDIHLFSHNYLVVPLEGQGDIRYLYLFSAVAFLILLIAGINYVNITTARASQRAKEVGIRKAAGAYKKQLIYQFTGESLLIMGLALTAGILLAELTIPAVNDFLVHDLNLHFLRAGWLWLTVGSIILLVGLLSGAYSAFVLSRFNPVQVIKGNLGMASWGGMRKALVIFQFSISITLIIATMVMYLQLQFVKNKNLGFNDEQVMTISTQKALINRGNIFKTELLNYPRITSVTLSNGIPGDPFGIFVVPADNIEGINAEKDFIVLNYFKTDEDFKKTYQFELVDGRMFNSEFSTDSTQAVIINETAAKKFGWQNPIGKSIKINGDRSVIGVVKDFHFETLKTKIQPMVMVYGSSNPDHVSIRLSTNNIPETLDYIGSIWKKIVPSVPFTYTFVDQNFDNMYRAEQNLGELFAAFAFLAICIASLGLFGLISYTTERRIKEICIRKILGAKSKHLITTLSREIIGLMLLSFAIAVPVTWYFMNQWLTNFAYRIELGPEIYLVAGVITLLVIAVSIGWPTTRALIVNPVENLRRE